jgi:hypothetical protein
VERSGKNTGEGNIMKISINGNYLCDAKTDAFFKQIDQNTYNSLGQAIQDKLANAIHQTDWYNYQPQNFDLVKNFNDVQAHCNNDLPCYMDSLNWAIMNKSELTADIYKFIVHRVHVVKQGFAENFWPSDHMQHVLNFIDWHFILDCVSWFI